VSRIILSFALFNLYLVFLLNTTSKACDLLNLSLSEVTSLAEGLYFKFAPQTTPKYYRAFTDIITALSRCCITLNSFLSCLLSIGSSTFAPSHLLSLSRHFCHRPMGISASWL